MEQGEPEGMAVTLPQFKVAEHSQSQPPQQPAVDTDGLDWAGDMWHEQDDSPVLLKTLWKETPASPDAHEMLVSLRLEVNERCKSLQGEQPLDVVVILDLRMAKNTQLWKQCEAAVRSLLSLLDTSDRVCVAIFGNHGFEMSGLCLATEEVKQSIMAAVDILKCQDSEASFNIADCLEPCVRYLDGEDRGVKQIMVLITGADDGTKENVDVDGQDRPAHRAAQAFAGWHSSRLCVISCGDMHAQGGTSASRQHNLCETARCGRGLHILAGREEHAASAAMASIIERSRSLVCSDVVLTIRPARGVHMEHVMGGAARSARLGDPTSEWGYKKNRATENMRDNIGADRHPPALLVVKVGDVTTRAVKDVLLRVDIPEIDAGGTQTVPFNVADVTMALVYRHSVTHRTSVPIILERNVCDHSAPVESPIVFAHAARFHAVGAIRRVEGLSSLSLRKRVLKAAIEDITHELQHIRHSTCGWGEAHEQLLLLVHELEDRLEKLRTRLSRPPSSPFVKRLNMRSNTDVRLYPTIEPVWSPNCTPAAVSNPQPESTMKRRRRRRSRESRTRTTSDAGPPTERLDPTRLVRRRMWWRKRGRRGRKAGAKRAEATGMASGNTNQVPERVVQSAESGDDSCFRPPSAPNRPLGRRPLPPRPARSDSRDSVSSQASMGSSCRQPLSPAKSRRRPLPDPPRRPDLSRPPATPEGDSDSRRRLISRWKRCAVCRHGDDCGNASCTFTHPYEPCCHGVFGGVAGSCGGR